MWLGYARFIGLGDPIRWRHRYIYKGVNSMATYHGIEHLECLQCGWQTRDDETMEIVNDGDGYCPKCDNQFFIWSMVDGEQAVTSGGKQGGRSGNGSTGYHRIRGAWIQ